MSRHWFSCDANLADLVAAYPQASAALAECGVPASCATLQVAEAEGHGNALDLLTGLAQTLELPLDTRSEDWGEWAIDELIDHIVAVHHRFLRFELDRCSVLLQACAAGGSVLASETLGAFSEFRDHMLAHIDQEEQRLFPGCRGLETAPYKRVWSTDEFLAELRVMEHGHDDTGLELSGVCALAQALAADGSAVAAAVVRCLEQIRADLVQHSLIEDDYLVPAITHAEEVLDRRREGARRMSEHGF